MRVDLALVFSLLAVGLAALGVARAYVPPQQRTVNELRARVEELELDAESLHQRMNRRSNKENMEKARTAHEERKARRDKIEEDAVAILAAAKQQPAQPTQPESVKAELRKIAGLTH